MKRRAFIKTSGALGTLSLLPISCVLNTLPSKFKLGYQLFSIRDEMAKNPLETLKALKSFGYEDFEHYGFDPKDGSYYGYEASEFKTRLDDLGLSISSGHYPFAEYFNSASDTLTKYLDQCIQGALTMKSRYIVWPWTAPEYRNIEGYKKLAATMNIMGEQIKKAGLGFAYHNHGYEFQDLEGTTGYDIIIKETDPELVKLQMDMYWVMYEEKTTPIELVKEHAGRYVMWHIKDMHKTSRDYTELGNGSINYPEVLPDPGVSGLEFYYIEQGGNYSENSMKSAEYSAQYFKKRLQQRL
ncbi:MAG: sugar phosphate isomerase/epimerase [Bacteroidota bacterium]